MGILCILWPEVLTLWVTFVQYAPIHSINYVTLTSLAVSRFSESPVKCTKRKGAFFRYDRTLFLEYERVLRNQIRTRYAHNRFALVNLSVWEWAKSCLRIFFSFQRWAALWTWLLTLILPFIAHHLVFSVQPLFCAYRVHTRWYLIYFKKWWNWFGAKNGSRKADEH